MPALAHFTNSNANQALRHYRLSEMPNKDAFRNVSEKGKTTSTLIKR
jgi:hypothetical protein